tara:strand:- start:2399 stop:2605 length:207 start_codon:yes stop_codon:yes gene_type:complete
MTEEKKLPKIIYKEKEYEQEKLTEKQIYLFSQVLDIEKKEKRLKFEMDQLLASKEKMEEFLEKELSNG